MEEQIRLDRIDDSPTNRRTHYDAAGLEELAASIKSAGVAQAILVRPKPHGRYECVFGHRRRRAAALAGLETIPANVRELSDDEVIELQIIENAQREDIHPLDEADSFAELIRRGYSIATIADRIGCSRWHVANRVKLASLIKPARTALEKRILTIGAAIELARIPPDVARKALVELKRWAMRWPEGIPGPEAKRIIQERYLVRLSGAPFKLPDAELDTDAGACTGCPKRTGANPDLFGDITKKSEELCLDPKCFERKCKAAFARLQKQRPNDKFLTGDAAREAAEGWSSTYAKTTGKQWVLNQNRDMRKLLKQAKHKDLQRVHALHPDTGQVVELVRKADLEKSLGAKKTATTTSYDQKHKLERKIAGELAKRAHDEAVLDSQRSPSQLLPIVVAALIHRSEEEACKAVCRRYDIEPDGSYGGHRIALKQRFAEAWESGRPSANTLQIATSLAIEAHAPPPDWGMDGSEQWRGLMKDFGVDVAKIKRAVIKEEKEKAAAKSKRKAKPKTKAKAERKAVKR